jgi:hypothetical protein
MGSRLTARPLVVGAGLFVSGLAVGAAIVAWASSPSRAEIREGGTLMSVLPETVMSLAYASPGATTTAQRSVPDTPFQILSTFADGRAAQRCSALADLEGRLDKLATLTARRGLSLEQRASEFPVQLGIIEVRDAVIGEPASPVLVFTNKNRTALAVVLDGRAAEVTLQAAELQWLETACSGSSSSRVGQ